jgi:hypothetical protein
MKNNQTNTPLEIKIKSLFIIAIFLILFLVPFLTNGLLIYQNYDKPAPESIEITEVSDYNDNYYVNTGTRGRASTYNSSEIFKVHGGSLAGALVTGDFDDDEYQEVVVVGGSSEGNTNLIDYNLENDTFDSQLLWWDPNGGLIDVTVGELDGSNTVPEILVGGYSGNLTQIEYNGPGNVVNKTIWNTTLQDGNSLRLNHIFGIAIGEVDDRFAGNEIAVVDAATFFIYLLANDSGTWVESKVPLGDLPRSVMIGEFDATHIGQEALVMCVNGTVYKVALETNPYSWSVVELFKDTKTPFSAVFDDFNASHPGNEVIMTGLSWNTTMLWGSGDAWYNKTIWTAPGALEGIVYGDFDHLHAGPELCITGYSNTAVMLYETPTGWYNELIYTDPDPLQTELNGVVLGDFYAHNPGDELIIIGFTGKIRQLFFEPPDFKLFSPSISKTVIADDFATFQIGLVISSGYSSEVQLSVTGVPPESTYNFSRSIITPTQGDSQDILSSVLTIDTSTATPTGIYDLKITGTSAEDNRKRFVNLSLTVFPHPDPQDFQLSVTPASKSLNISREQYIVEFEINIIPIALFDDTVDLYLDEVDLNNPDFKNYIEYSITPNPIRPDEKAVINISISKELKRSINFKLTIHGSNSAMALEHSQEVNLNIIYYEEPDKPDNGDQDDGLHQWVGLGLMVIVIIVITGFLLKRMRDISRHEQAVRERRLQERQAKLGPGQRQKKRM